MDVREKLIGLVKNALRAYGRDLEKVVEPYDFIADFLIHSGVTVQECGNWKYYHKQNKAVCTSCSFERDLDANFGKAIACPNCGAYMPQPPKGE